MFSFLRDLVPGHRTMQNNRSSPCKDLKWPSDLQEFETLRISRQVTNESSSVVNPSTGRLYPLNIYFCYRLNRPQGHSAARRIK